MSRYYWLDTTCTLCGSKRTIDNEHLDAEGYIQRCPNITFERASQDIHLLEL